MQRGTVSQASAADLKNLQRIPGVGPSLAQDLWELGYHSVAELTHQDAEKMYADLEALRGQPMDPCVLYVFRCAVYFASTSEHEPELLKWWNWKNRRL
jgi:hypothetical protein